MFNISTFKHFIYTPEKIETKPFINGLMPSNFLLKKTNCFSELSTFQTYSTSQVLINKKKTNDVKKLWQYVIEHNDFYEEILSWSTLDIQNNQMSHYEKD